MTPFSIKIITPEKTFFQGTTTQIIAKTTSGNVGILHGHVPYVANLVSSPFKIEIDGELKEAAISGGFLKVSSEDVIVVTNAIEWADEIDADRAAAAQQAAEERLRTMRRDDVDYALAEAKLKRALIRQQVKG